MKKLSTLSLASDGEIKISMLYQKKGKGVDFSRSPIVHFSVSNFLWSV